MTQRCHVPKFGDWDSDNIPYTSYFENARKEKAVGVRLMNPNDPEENPEAFMFLSDGIDVTSHTVPAPVQFDSDKPLPSGNHQTEKPKKQNNYNHRRNSSKPLKSITSDEPSYTSASIPKFGAWDERDPMSGEGFTVIFNKVKQEKQITAARFPTPPRHNNSSDSRKKEYRSKICCCLFSGARD